MRCINNSLFRRVQLQLLMNLTARAFQLPTIHIWQLAHHAALRKYTDFTREKLSTGADDELLKRMNSEAYKMGRLLRIVFLVRSEDYAQRIVQALYRNIAINMSFAADGRICFHHCSFSKHYTPTVCRAASALDDGIIRGLTGRQSSRLCFSQRITEGCDCCLAKFEQPNKNNQHI